ncbi:sulfonate transport system ATP-binding protein [Thermoflexales bacterium]|nr:sulfonate transport system ATP-binding protein [Thermoflexales bacterium]
MLDKLLPSTQTESAASVHQSNAAIQTQQLVKVYKTAAGNYPALKGIDLQVQHGEFVALLGKSGAGKSTMINLITGIDRPTSGEIVVNGTAIHDLHEDQRSRWRGLNLGVVFQFFQLLPSLTLIENITLVMDFCNTYPLRERKARALHLLDQVGIAEHAYKIPSRISGGQQQRVAIARALANDPPIIVADEPTGNLDSRTAHEIFDLFSSLVAQGKTLLVVTHDKEIAARATRLIEMADGQIVKQ